MIMKEDMIMPNSKGMKDVIQAQCEQIWSILADPMTSKFDKTKLQEHLAKLSGDVWWHLAQEQHRPAQSVPREVN